MKKTKTLAIAAAVTVVAATILITSTGVLADQVKAWSPKALTGYFAKGFAKGDPVELNKEKANLQQKVKDGKLTQEEADKKIADIDKKIKEIQDFNSLTLNQKKEKVLNEFTTGLNQKVKDGKLTQDAADKAAAAFKSKLDKWDGTGKMPFAAIEQKGEGKFEFKNGARPGTGMKGNIDPAQMLEKQKENLQQRVKDGKLTQEEADKRLADIEAKVKEMQEFNSMTVEQKKEKLLSNFTTSINERAKAGKMTQEEADKAIADYKSKLDSWDGTGKLPFGDRGHKGGKDFKGAFKKGAAASQQ